MRTITLKLRKNEPTLERANCIAIGLDVLTDTLRLENEYFIFAAVHGRALQSVALSVPLITDRSFITWF